jgi:hypothetical protein
VLAKAHWTICTPFRALAAIVAGLFFSTCTTITCTKVKALLLANITAFMEDRWQSICFRETIEKYFSAAIGTVLAVIFHFSTYKTSSTSRVCV